MQSEPKHEIPYEMFLMDPKDEPDIHAFTEEEALTDRAWTANDNGSAASFAQETTAWD